LSWLKTFDLRLSWEHTYHERIAFQPSISVFNLFNFANFDLPGNTQNGVLNFGAASLSPWATALQPQNTIGGTSVSGVTGRSNRASLQSGMSATGAPRSPESTNEEAAYLKQLTEKQSSVLIKLVTGEKLRGWIEYYDRNMLRLTRQDQPNLFIYKQQIAYVAEESK
jgi:host factor-I protein